MRRAGEPSLVTGRLVSLAASRWGAILQAATFAVFLATLAVPLAMVRARLDCPAYHRVGSIDGVLGVASLACAVLLTVSRGAAQVWLRRGWRAGLLTVAVFAAQATVSVGASWVEFDVTVGYCNPSFPFGSGNLDGLDPCLLGCAH